MCDGELLLPFPGGVAREDVGDATHLKTMFSSRSSVSIVPEACSHRTLGYHASWV